MTNTKNRKNKKILSITLKVIIYLVLSLWAIGTIFPFVWVLLNSFKSSDNIMSNAFSLPVGNLFTSNNYRNLFTGKYKLLKAYLNSFIISGSVVLVTLVISGITAFVLSRFNFKGKKIFYSFIIACMMFPIFSIIFPLLNILVKLRINDTYLGVILPQIAGNIGFATIVLKGFIDQLPVDVEESAYLDGANIFTVIFRLIVPMSKSAFVSCGIFVFLWSYNDLFLQMLVINDISLKPVVAILNEISSKEGTDFGLMAASVSAIAMPLIAIYFGAQKHIIKGLTAGAVKG